MDEGCVSDFDLKTYAARYSGTVLAYRMCFVADRFPELARTAVLRALKELKSGINTTLYIEILEKYRKFLADSDACQDAGWVTETNAKAQETLDRLHSELSALKTAGVKDSIRMSYSDIGYFYQRRGQYDDAMKAFSKAREFCNTERTANDIAMSCVRMCLESNNFRSALAYSHKLEHDATMDSRCRGVVTLAEALNNLYDGQYINSAGGFLSLDEAESPLAPEDVALCSTLLAIASLDRTTVKRSIVQSQRFRKFLENVPELRKFAECYADNRFGECVRQLEHLEPWISADMYLATHFSYLKSRILEKVVANYCTPYDTVGLDTMSTVIGLPLTHLQAVVLRLIASGELNFRLDSVHNMLYRAKDDGVQTGVQSVLNVARTHSADMTRGLLRCSLFEHDFFVKPARFERMGIDSDLEGMMEAAAATVTAAAEEGTPGGR